MKTIVVDSNRSIRATVPPSAVEPTGKLVPRRAKTTSGAGPIAHVLDIPSDVAELGTTEFFRASRVNPRGKPGS